MESYRRLRIYRASLVLFAAGMALQGSIDLYRSSRDMFPQRELPSLGLTADTTIRILQQRLRDQNLAAGLQLLTCAGLVAALTLQVARGARPPEI
jgi:hypothetical protein